MTWRYNVFRMAVGPGYPTPYCATARRPGEFINGEGRTPEEAMERLRHRIAKESNSRKVGE